MARNTPMLYRNRVAHQFSQSPMAMIGRSRFSRSHGYKTTFGPDYLYPFLLEEVLPGDTWKVRTNSVVRVEAMLKPIMDSLYLDTFYFFIPNRLIWDNFQRFMGEQDDPADSIDFLLPSLESLTSINAGDTRVAVGSLWDYFGLPVTTTDSGKFATVNTNICSLPFRAYNLVWNQWFRDENLQDSVPVPRDDGPDSFIELGWGSNNGLLKRAKVHDYFTSALPWPQKGPAVDIPIGDLAPVIYGRETVATGAGVNQLLGQPVGYWYNTGGTNSRSQWAYGTTATSGGTGITEGNQEDFAVSAAIPLMTDLSSATAVSINSLRQAFQLQKFYERMARGGSRYIEIIKAHFGVISPDARLQRTEYLGGSSTPMVFNTIAQTSSTDSISPQANLSATGIATGNIGGFTRSFVEHGWILGLVNVRADLTYQQGVNRKWLRRTREDFYWPTFAHLGEQAIQNIEIYFQGTAADGEVFGYQERYAEYRYAQSIITSEMRSAYAQSLDIWHLGQDFASLPTLNSDFIQSSVPMSRVVAVSSRPPFVGDFWHDIQCVRPMPLYGTPGLVDHF